MKQPINDFSLRLYALDDCVWAEFTRIVITGIVVLPHNRQLSVAILTLYSASLQNRHGL